MQKRSLNQNEQFNQSHSGHPRHVILNLIQDLNRDAECPQHDSIGSESGRSMVEMLGVLAVMGLLTIIGIAGFKIAMNKAKANNLVSDMNRLAHVVSMDKFSGYSADAIDRAVEEHNQDTEYPATCNSTFKSTMFSLTLKNPIDKEMCEQVANLGWAVPQGVFLNEVEKTNFAAEDCADSNTLTWVFMDDLSHCSDCVLSDTKCDTYGDECGSCSDLRGFTPDETKCTDPEKRYCVRGTCTKCEPGYFLNTKNGCNLCGTESYYYGDQDLARFQAWVCLGDNFYGDFGGKGVWPCNRSTATIDGADEVSCKACNNRCYNPVNHKCSLTGEGYAYDRDKKGECVCREGYYLKNDNTCTACGTVGFPANMDQIHRCLTKNFYGNWGYFYMWNCDNTNVSSPWNSDEIGCKACANRCYKNGTCYLVDATHQRVSETDGACAD